jgi:GTP cyclohydrolase I
VAYIPGTKVLGLSKMNRIVKFFSQRPQVQERLTSQIHAALCYILETDDVAVIIEAEHMCVKTRGIEDACSDTVTSKLTGKFRESAMRQELMTFIKARA